VLGVDVTATDDEIKKAYRELAKKYHPDNYANSPLADLAQEKMKEINEAYDSIQRERAEGGRESRRAYSSFAEIRSYIENGDFYEAGIRLDAVMQSERNAEWFYLKGRVNESKGFFFEAERCYDTACALDPQNAEYRNAAMRLKNGAQGFDNRRYGGTPVGGCSVCDVCAGIMCIDCCCDCMGFGC
jgi:tetratricopeptide (TPR) repeat protein